MRKAILAACLMLACGTASAQMNEWDEDNNDALSEDEFFSGVDDSGLYGNIDTDNDGFIDEDEFGKTGVDGEYDEWDADNDGYLDSDEFYEGTYETFDENDDDSWSEEEFDTANEEDWLSL